MEENIFSFKVCVKARGVKYEKIVLSLTAQFKIKKIFVTKQKLMKSSYLIACDTTLMKMFNLLGIGERAGSGIPDIYQVWTVQGWNSPVVEEFYNPDRTRLSLDFSPKASEESKRRKQAKKTSEENKRRKQAKKN